MFKENWQTRLNYSPRAKGVLSLAAFYAGSLAARSFNEGIASIRTPPYMVGRVRDIFAGAVQASAAKAILNSENTLALSACGFIANASSELYQGIGWEQGTFDPGDFVAFGVGAIAWGLFDKSAKLLYDSGATKPIYNVLNIRDRRIYYYYNQRERRLTID